MAAARVECTDPPRDCGLCDRLASFRGENRTKSPEWYNAPVPTFGAVDARLLIVGLAPGLKGANRTGRPFTGDFAGDLLYGTLLAVGLARGVYKADPADGLRLTGCRITNAVRCVPPQNKPVPQEIANCRSFLEATIAEMGSLRAILVLGRIAHDSTLSALKARRAAHPFSHGARHQVSASVTVFDSYHCSRYNTNTGVLTPAMFRDVFAAIGRHLDAT